MGDIEGKSKSKVTRMIFNQGAHKFASDVMQLWSVNTNKKKSQFVETETFMQPTWPASLVRGCSQCAVYSQFLQSKGTQSHPAPIVSFTPYLMPANWLLQDGRERPSRLLAYIMCVVSGLAYKPTPSSSVGFGCDMKTVETICWLEYNAG